MKREENGKGRDDRGSDFKTWICLRAAEMTGSAGNRL